MIKELSVKNFKSVKDLKIDCRRINLFIGEPNTGKSNILETLGLLSWCGHDNYLTEYVRFQNVRELFYDGNYIDESVEMVIKTEDETDINMHMKFDLQNEEFLLLFEAKLRGGVRWGGDFHLSYSGERRTGATSGDLSSNLKLLKPYRFKQQEKFKGTQSSFLTPPHGSNMFALVMGSKRLRELMSKFFEDFGFKLILKPQEKTFEMLKQGQDVVFTYPYILLPDTLQRVVFYTIAIESNEDSTLIFEDPESHAFPDYIVYMGRKIAFDEKNQYFIATHNPYFLLSILEKAPKDDVNVFVTYIEDYQTKVKRLNDEEVSEIMVYDPFANLDRLIGRLESFVEEEEQ